MLAPPLFTTLLSLASLSKLAKTANADTHPIWGPIVIIDGTGVSGQFIPISTGNTTADSENPKGYYSFPNIRYALPPTGPRRFEKPVAVPWKSPPFLVQKWLSNPICPQAYPGWMCPKHSTVYDEEGNPSVNEYNLGWCRDAEEKVMSDWRQSEDCLFLDVYVPRGVFENRTEERCADRDLAPVVVNFGTTALVYGSKEAVGMGGPSPAVLTQHSTDPEDENPCATKYPVVVSINYRLGMFGWFNDKNGTQNLGLWDQRLAMEWVSQHVQVFGGDPDRITLLGMGAGGGGSIMHQLTAFERRPNPNPPWYYKNGSTTFQQAIVMSPTWHFTPDREGTFKAVMDVATNISGSLISTVEQLKGLSTETLLRINRKVVKEAPLNEDVFGPVAGGKFAPEHPAVLLRDGRFDPNVKIIVGHGFYHHLRAGPFGGTVKEVRDSLAALLHGYSNQTLDFIVNKLYSPEATNEFIRWYRGKRTKKLSQRIIPLAIRRELYLSEEILIGCNTRHIAHAYAHGNHTYAYDALDSSSGNMMGLFSDQKGTYRERFLRFIGSGTPDVNGGWQAYGGAYGNLSLVLEDDPGHEWEAQMTRDIYQNERCRWWLERGYELLH
ncbi:Carboxylesterase family domain containing protein [Naviculisporaceae sp. PSN 640]